MTMFQRHYWNSVVNRVHCKK